MRCYCFNIASKHRGKQVGSDFRRLRPVKQNRLRPPIGNGYLCLSARLALKFRHIAYERFCTTENPLQVGVTIRDLDVVSDIRTTWWVDNDGHGTSAEL